MAFVPLTADERQAMLEQIGVGSVAELFEDIPAAVRFPHLDVPPPLTEIETVAKMSALAARNQHVGQLACFVGAGYYNHYSPSIVSHLMGRSEFYTSYTPYQPEGPTRSGPGSTRPPTVSASGRASIGATGR